MKLKFGKNDVATIVISLVLLFLAFSGLWLPVVILVAILVRTKAYRSFTDIRRLSILPYREKEDDFLKELSQVTNTMDRSRMPTMKKPEPIAPAVEKAPPEPPVSETRPPATVMPPHVKADCVYHQDIVIR